VSKLSAMEQLHSEWLTAKAAWEQGQKEVNDTMLQFCLGKSRAPTRKKLDNVVILLKDMCEAQAQLDNFMREYMSAPPCMELVGKTVEKQM
jgi:hypothetical protein